MPKKVFWPATLVVIGLILLASTMGMLPQMFYRFWPVLAIIVGLGGLLTSDRDDWMVDETKLATKRPKKSVARASAKRSAKKSKSRSKR